MRNKVNHVTAVDHSIDSLLALYKELPAGTRLTDLSFSELLVGLFFSRTQVAIENARNELYKSQNTDDETVVGVGRKFQI